MLIAKRKFDIRIWVLLTQSNKVYIFKQGYIRTSSVGYSLDQDLITRQEVHLTNNAIQQQSEHYGRFESGNQLSFDQFRSHTDLFDAAIWPDILKLVSLSFDSV